MWQVITSTGELLTVTRHVWRAACSLAWGTSRLRAVERKTCSLMDNEGPGISCRVWAPSNKGQVEAGSPEHQSVVFFFLIWLLRMRRVKIWQVLHRNSTAKKLEYLILITWYLSLFSHGNIWPGSKALRCFRVGAWLMCLPVLATTYCVMPRFFPFRRCTWTCAKAGDRTISQWSYFSTMEGFNIKFKRGGPVGKQSLDERFLECSASRTRIGGWMEKVLEGGHLGLFLTWATGWPVMPPT